MPHDQAATQQPAGTTQPAATQQPAASTDAATLATQELKPAAVTTQPAAPDAAAKAAADEVALAAKKAAATEAANKEAQRRAALSADERAAEDKAKEQKEADAAKETARRAALTEEQRKAEDDAKAKSEAEAKAKAVPEKYGLKAPDGMAIDAELTGEFEKAAKELGLSQENAQRLYELGAKVVTKNTAAITTSVKALQDSWLAASKSDKEFGGENLAKNISIAQTAMKFATPELKKILNESRLGDHPEMIRWMYRVGKAMAEDTFVAGTQKADARDTSFEGKAKRQYPSMNP